MIDSVAQAIARQLRDPDWQAYLPAARAAVAALRKPHEDMLEAAMPGFPDWGYLPDEWQKMIDWVLSEEGEYLRPIRSSYELARAQKATQSNIA